MNNINMNNSKEDLIVADIHNTIVLMTERIMYEIFKTVLL